MKTCHLVVGVGGKAGPPPWSFLTGRLDPRTIPGTITLRTIQDFMPHNRPRTLTLRRCTWTPYLGYAVNYGSKSSHSGPVHLVTCIPVQFTTTCRATRVLGISFHGS